MFNALEFLRDYAVPYWTDGKNVADGFVNINCPMCADSSNHGGFSPTGSYICWRCGNHKTTEVLEELLSCDRNQAYALYREYQSESFIERKLNEKPKKPFVMPTGKITRAHREYLRSRGFNAKRVIEQFQLGGTVFAGRKKLVIPIIYKGRVVSYQTRGLSAEDRYFGCPIDEAIIPYKEILYNLDACKEPTVIVVEGVVDTWRMGDNCCCTFGTSVTKEQKLLLADYGTVVVLFDPEEEALRKAYDLAEELAMMGVDAYVEDTYLQDCGVEDPGELTLSQSRDYKAKWGLT